MTEHIVSAFNKELETLDHKIAEMGGLAEKMLSEAMEALGNLNLDLARQVITADLRLDTLQREVEDNAILTIARRQPMAVDLREVVAAIRVSGDLERVGDLAKNIAKRTLIVAKEQRPQMPRAIVGLRHMNEIAAMMMKDVLDAYAQRDVALAKSVWQRDGELDALENSVFRDLLTFMMEDARNITLCTHLLFCSKNIERIGDHATNIAETVVYLVSGEAMPLERPKGTTSLLDKLDNGSAVK